MRRTLGQAKHRSYSAGQHLSHTPFEPPFKAVEATHQCTLCAQHRANRPFFWVRRKSQPLHKKADRPKTTRAHHSLRMRIVALLHVLDLASCAMSCGIPLLSSCLSASGCEPCAATMPPTRPSASSAAESSRAICVDAVFGSGSSASSFPQAGWLKFNSEGSLTVDREKGQAIKRQKLRKAA